MKGKKLKSSPRKTEQPLLFLRTAKPGKVFLLERSTSSHDKDSSNGERSVPSLLLPKLDKSRGSLGGVGSPQSLSARSLYPDPRDPEKSPFSLSDLRPPSQRRSGVLSPHFMMNVLQRTNDLIKCSDSSIDLREEEPSLQKLMAGKSRDSDLSNTCHLVDLETGPRSGFPHMSEEESKGSTSKGIISFANVSRKRGLKRGNYQLLVLNQRLRNAHQHIRDLQSTNEDVKKRMEFHRERIKVLEEYCLNLNARFKTEMEKLKNSLAEVQIGQSSVRQIVLRESSTSTEEVSETTNTPPVPRPETSSQCCEII